MINIAFTPINHNTANPKNDARSWSTSALSSCQNILQRAQTFGGYLLPRTVAHYTNDQIKKDRTSQMSLSLHQKGWLGVTTELKNFLPSLCVRAFIVVPVLNRILDTLGFPDDDASKNICEYSFRSVGIIGPFVEEIIFRGILQNSVSVAQKTMRFYMPSCLRGRIMNWMTSPQARILVVNGLFGAMHLRNAGSYLSSKAAIKQAIAHTIFSREAGLYETTDSLVAPFAAHVTNNTLVYSVVCSR